MKRILLTVFFMAVVSYTSFADENDLSALDIFSQDIEELINIKVERVIAASKTVEPIKYASASTTVVTSYEIKTQGYKTLADILKAQKGFYITYDRNYNYAGMRGLYKAGDYNSRILILIDGHQINDNIYDQAFIGTDFPLDIDLIDRVEIVRGPVSSLYGGNGLFGVINVITKNPDKNELSFSAGSFDTYQGRITLQGNFFENGYFLTSATYYQSHGQKLYFKEFDVPGVSDGRNYRGDYDKYPSFYFKTKFEDFTLEAGYISRTKGIPTGAWETIYNDNRNFSIDERAFFDLRFDHLFQEKYELMVRLFLDKYTYKGNYVYPEEIQNEIDNGDSVGSEIKLTYLSKNLRIFAGAELRDNFRQNININGSNSGEIYDFRHNSVNIGTYGGSIIDISKYLILNLSLRYDYFEFYDDGLSGRAAFVISPYKNGIYKLILGNSYRPPNIYEMYYNDNNQTQKAPEGLKSETINQAELIYEHYINEQMTSSLSIFYNDINNLIGFDIDNTDGLIVAKNIDDIQLAGVEAEISYLNVSGITGSLSYSYTYAYNEKSKNEVKSYPSHMLKSRLAYPILKRRITPAISFNYLSERETLSSKMLDPVLIADFNVLLSIVMDWDVSIGVYNLFNQKYFDAASIEHPMDAIEQDGISFRLKIGGKF